MTRKNIEPGPFGTHTITATLAWQILSHRTQRQTEGSIAPSGGINSDVTEKVVRSGGPYGFLEFYSALQPIRVSGDCCGWLIRVSGIGPNTG